jgi:hypothetical protein
MLHKTLFLSLFLATAVLVGGVCSQTLNLTQTSKAQVSGLPVVDWPYFIDGTDEVIGIISENCKLFTLYGKDGTPRFSARSAKGRFVSVKISQYDGVVLLADVVGDELYWYTAYDYDGTKIFESEKMVGPMEASPTGKFYYTINDFVMGAGRPAVYGKDGRLLAEYGHSSGFWEMKAIGDSMVLFQDGPRLRTISVPAMTVVTEMEVTGIDPPMIAFDLENSNVLFVDKPRHSDRSLNVDLLLAPGGEHLVLFWTPVIGTHQVQVWKRDSDRFLMTAEKRGLPFDTPMELSIRSHVITDGFCGLNYFTDRRNLAFRAYLFDYGSADGAAFGGEVVTGFASLAPHSEHEVRVVEVDADTSGSYILQSYHVDVEDDK